MYEHEIQPYLKEILQKKELILFVSSLRIGAIRKFYIPPFFKRGMQTKTISLTQEMLKMETITIPKQEYEYLKRIELVAQQELALSIRRGLEDAAKGKLRER